MKMNLTCVLIILQQKTHLFLICLFLISDFLFCFLIFHFWKIKKMTFFLLNLIISHSFDPTRIIIHFLGIFVTNFFGGRSH